MKGVIALLVLIAISAGVFALGTLRRKSDGKPLLHVADEVALKVNVAKPQRGEIIRLAQAPGDVEAVLDVDIRGPVRRLMGERPRQHSQALGFGNVSHAPRAALIAPAIGDDHRLVRARG